MNFRTLITRSLRFYARAHLGVLLGAAVGSVALIGALVVGDSVRISLRDMALARLGKVDFALAAGDRLFRDKLGEEIVKTVRQGTLPPDETSDRLLPIAASILQLPGIATTADGSARANHVQVLGVNENFWQLANQQPASHDLATDTVVLNNALAEQLKVKVGDLILVRIQKPSLLSRDAPISSQNDSSVALRLKLTAIVADKELGRFSLQANQIAPFNAFVNLGLLQEKIEQKGRANLLLFDNVQDKDVPHRAPNVWEGMIKRDWLGTNQLNVMLENAWQLADAELELRELPDNGGVELRSRRVFLDPPVVASAQKICPEAKPVLTYFVNEFHSTPFATPYSMVAAMGAPIVPTDMHDDEILLNDWLGDDLDAKPGDTITVKYYVIGNGRALTERSQEFKVHGIVPMTGAAADRRLMPDFPGIAEADSSSDWDAGFAIDLKRIRPKDEQYWKQFRGTPKAFITLAAGQKMWSNRFGDCTAIRFPASAGSLKKIDDELRKAISPASVGLSFQPVRAQALAASENAVDFGQLFIGFSFFLIVAALLMMGLLFQLGLEQRAREIGTLLALGYRPRQVRLLFLGEGAVLAFIGGIIGAGGGIFYAKALLLGLTTIWRGAVGTSTLQYHATPATLVIGLCASTVVSVITIWITLWRQGRRPARELLANGAEENTALKGGLRKRSYGVWIGSLSTLAAIGLMAATFLKGERASADTFFSAGSLLLVGGLGFCAMWLAATGKHATNVAANFTVSNLGWRSCGRRRKRSLTTIGLIACGVFLIVAIGAFRIDTLRNTLDPASGTGGFQLIGQSALPVTYDLNHREGQDFYGLDTALIKSVHTVAFRVHDGDEASCLNLNSAQTPRLLGVNGKSLDQRHSFTFTDAIKATDEHYGWQMLASTNHLADEIPAIGDENSILWAMHKKVGDTVDYVDERGRPFKVRIVGALANSILQGSLMIDEDEFVKRFPGESGYRMFLFDTPLKEMAAVSTMLTRALQNSGLELIPAAQRLDVFNAVQNTYLSTFQVLGGLGLLLGSAGLGVVVLRNVQERRGELALLLAVGFRRSALQWLVLSEHSALLGLGLAVGIVAAALGVLPSLLAPGAHVPFASLAITVGVVFVNGLIWTWVATRIALRGKLIESLKNE